MTRPVVKADVDSRTITVAGEELDSYEAIGLIAELSTSATRTRGTPPLLSIEPVSASAETGSSSF